MSQLPRYMSRKDSEVAKVLNKKGRSDAKVYYKIEQQGPGGCQGP